MLLELLDQTMNRFGDFISEFDTVQQKDTKVVVTLDLALNIPVDSQKFVVLELIMLVCYLNLINVFN